MSYQFLVHGDRWAARQGGSGQLASFAYPEDFPGYPANPAPGTDQVVLVDWIKMVVSTSITAANRRPRLKVIDENGQKQIEWHSGVTLPALTNSGIVHFSSNPGGQDVITGGVLRMELPSGVLMMTGWHLELDLIGVQAGDSIDEVCFGGRFEG